jgi:hypothetical protein
MKLETRFAGRPNSAAQYLSGDWLKSKIANLRLLYESAN